MANTLSLPEYNPLYIETKFTTNLTIAAWIYYTHAHYAIFSMTLINIKVCNSIVTKMILLITNVQ